VPSTNTSQELKTLLKHYPVVEKNMRNDASKLLKLMNARSSVTAFVAAGARGAGRAGAGKEAAGGAGGGGSTWARRGKTESVVRKEADILQVTGGTAVIQAAQVRAASSSKSSLASSSSLPGVQEDRVQDDLACVLHAGGEGGSNEEGAAEDNAFFEDGGPLNRQKSKAFGRRESTGAGLSQVPSAGSFKGRDQALDFDSAPDPFATKIGEKNRFLLDPNRGFRVKWDVILAFVIVYSCLVVPYRMAYDVPAAEGWLVLELIMDGMFFIDIVLNFVRVFE
jgi:hypothetical protein